MTSIRCQHRKMDLISYQNPIPGPVLLQLVCHRMSRGCRNLLSAGPTCAAITDGRLAPASCAVLPDTGLPASEGATGKKRSRKALPENLPRERVEYDLPDDQKACPCCRHQMHRMGEAVTEQLHIEVKAKVLQNVRFKYACRHCDRTGINTPVAIAPMPTQPLPGSIATASTLAFAFVHKYVDGAPLYRLAQAFERAGVPVSRGALGHWVIGSSEKHFFRICSMARCTSPSSNWHNRRPSASSSARDRSAARRDRPGLLATIHGPLRARIHTAGGLPVLQRAATLFDRRRCRGRIGRAGRCRAEPQGRGCAAQHPLPRRGRHDPLSPALADRHGFIQTRCMTRRSPCRICSTKFRAMPKNWR